MACKDCEKAVEEAIKNGKMFFYRWKNANIGLVGCRKHIKEIMKKHSTGKIIRKNI